MIASNGEGGGNPSPLITISYPAEQVESLADRLATVMGTEQVGLAIFATSLILVRLLGPDQLAPNKQIEAVDALIDWASTYLAAEEAN